MSQPASSINWRQRLRRLFRLDARGSDGQLVRLARPYARYLPLLIVLALGASLFEGVGLGLVIPLMALAISDAAPTTLPPPMSSIFDAVAGFDPAQKVTILGATLLALILVRALLQTFNSKLIGWLTGAIGRDVRNALANRILNLRYAFYLKADSDLLVEIIGGDSWRMSGALHLILSWIQALTVLCVFVLLLLWLDWRLFLLVAAGAAVVRGWLYIVERRLRMLGIEVTRSNNLLGQRMYEIVVAMRVIRLFDQQAREQKRFDELTERVRHSMYRTSSTSAWTAPGVDALTFLLFLLVFFAGYRMGVSVPELIGFLLLLSRAQPHAKVVSEAQLGVAAAKASIEQVEWLLRQEPEHLRDHAPPVPPLDQAPIAFRNVTFEYPGERSGLHDVSFTIRPGVTTALIGASGAGKSTVVNLLCGLLEPTAGEILVGDVSLRDAAGPAWRERIAVAGQGIGLVGGSIAENIAYGCTGVTRDEVVLAARAAGLDDFIANLPEGYDTDVGQWSLRLSGGQGQRIGIARALLRRPDLLIFDEATSAVDAPSEREIFRLLSGRDWFRSALVISHRRSTLAACQDGIVLRDGRVVDAGPLRELEYYDVMMGTDE